jgi:hypothetical protein
MSLDPFASLRVLWMPLGLSWGPASASVRHCCQSMEMSLEHSCDVHPTPFDCPDTVLIYNEPFDEYGIPVRDGGESYVIVTHCPWCGVELPESRRMAWFDEIDKLGLADAPFEHIPEKFLTAAWRTPGLS